MADRLGLMRARLLMFNEYANHIGQRPLKISESMEKEVPLKKSSSKKAVPVNIKKEIAAGKPPKQAVAIALNTQRQAKKKGK